MSDPSCAVLNSSNDLSMNLRETLTVLLLHPLGAHGGHPIFADGDIFLCGRTDHDPDRHFDGALTQLSLYDESLTSVQIKQLYDLVASEGTVKKKGLDYARELAKETVDISDEDLTQAVTQDGTSDVNQFRIEHFAVRSKYCRGNIHCKSLCIV